jgi:acyl-CoA oxidase
MARFVVERAADSVLYKTPISRIAQNILDSGSVRRSAGHLREEATQRELLTDRVEGMVAELATALRPASKLTRANAAELFNNHQHELIEAARAHADLVQWEAFTKALDGIEDAGTRQVLTWVRDLFGLVSIEKNLAWYLINGRLSGQRARTVTSYIDRLLARLRPHAQDLVDAFGYGPEHVRATIATGVEKERQDEAREYYRALRASGDEPVSEKSLKAKARTKG